MAGWKLLIIFSELPSEQYSWHIYRWNHLIEYYYYPSPKAAGISSPLGDTAQKCRKYVSF